MIQFIELKFFNLLSGSDSLLQYGNKPFAKHNFCKKCGIQVFSNISRPSGDKIGVNIGCIPDIDLDSLNPKIFDGANLF